MAGSCIGGDAIPAISMPMPISIVMFMRALYVLATE